MPDYPQRNRRRNIVLALVLAAVAVGFYVAFFIVMGSG